MFPFVMKALIEKFGYKVGMCCVVGLVSWLMYSAGDGVINPSSFGRFEPSRPSHSPSSAGRPFRSSNLVSPSAYPVQPIRSLTNRA